MNNVKVKILMATYNGADFIREQLESLIYQTYKDIEIYISDDGSSDNTVTIIRQYAEKDERIYLELSNHLGACRNFGNLIKNHRDADYIMLCDQDDVWNLDKVEKTLKVMQMNEEDGLPVLVYSGRMYVDEKLHKIDVPVRIYEDSFKSLLCQCHIYGCTMMLNKALISLVNIPEFASMHDHWIALVASCKGKIIRIDEELMMYRQHANNVTGGVKQFSVINKIRTWNKINNEGKLTNRMCYRFCVENKENIIAQGYIDMFNSYGLSRLVKAVKFGYKLDHILATVRGIYILLITKQEEG